MIINPYRYKPPSGGEPYLLGAETLSCGSTSSIERRWFGLALTVPTSGTLTKAEIAVSFSSYAGVIGFAVYDSAKSLVGSKAIDTDNDATVAVFDGLSIPVIGGQLYHFATIAELTSGNGLVCYEESIFSPDNGLFSVLDASAEPHSTVWAPPSSITGLDFTDSRQAVMRITVTP